MGPAKWHEHALRTTRYRLILMLCRDVFMFVVKQIVPSDEDLEWLYPSCLLYGKDFFRAFRSIADFQITFKLFCSLFYHRQYTIFTLYIKLTSYPSAENVLHNFKVVNSLQIMVNCKLIQCNRLKIGPAFMIRDNFRGFT